MPFDEDFVALNISKTKQLIRITFRCNESLFHLIKSSIFWHHIGYAWPLVEASRLSILIACHKQKTVHKHVYAPNVARQWPIRIPFPRTAHQTGTLW